MTLTLLIDLDDTLLSNDINTFLPAYLRALGKHMVGYVPPDKMARHLLAATQVMVANDEAGISLENAFDDAFYPAIGRTKAELRETLEHFYDMVFPGLESLTQPRPEAVQMVNSALAQGHTLVVATNPLFPHKAILHRLRWAGLAADQVPFSLITTYEYFHFAKPNPAYFAEILAQLGWPNQPAVMIGNSLEDDLTPAAKLGLPVYWVTNATAAEPPPALPQGFHPLSDAGSLQDVPAWLEKVDSANLRQTFTTPQAMLAVLKSTPAALHTFSQALTPAQWQQRPSPEEWSVTEILCHLRDVDREVNIPRIEMVANGENPFLPGINSDTWAEERKYLQEDGPSALRGFIESRGQLVRRLTALSESEWRLPARHAIFGPTTLQELVSFITTHDRTHIQQAQSASQALA